MGQPVSVPLINCHKIDAHMWTVVGWRMDDCAYHKPIYGHEYAFPWTAAPWMPMEIIQRCSVMPVGLELFIGFNCCIDRDKVKLWLTDWHESNALNTAHLPWPRRISIRLSPHMQFEWPTNQQQIHIIEPLLQRSMNMFFFPGNGQSMIHLPEDQPYPHGRFWIDKW